MPSLSPIGPISFTFLTKLRLEKQLAAVAMDSEPDNLIDPQLLSYKERDRLRTALKGVSTLIGILRGRYQLDMMAN